MEEAAEAAIKTRDDIASTSTTSSTIQLVKPSRRPDIRTVPRHDSLPPKLIVVAGPPGGGKTTLMGPAYFSGAGIPYFDSDDLCKQIYGHAQHVPRHIRRQVTDELQGFCDEHLELKRTFAFELTLREHFAISCAATAHAAGFETELHFIATTTGLHIKRVAARFLAGGHGASEYTGSMDKLPNALLTFDRCFLYDSTIKVSLHAVLDQGRLLYKREQLAPWVRKALLHPTLQSPSAPPPHVGAEQGSILWLRRNKL